MESMNQNLRPAVSVACQSGGRFLLVKRMNAPSKDMWAFPGGKVETGEKLEEAARREVLEETRITIGALRLIKHFDLLGRYRLHVFEALSHQGIARAGDDAADCGWFLPTEMAALPATGTTLEIVKLLAGGPSFSSKSDRD